MPKFTLVVAMTSDRLIGKGNKLPWDIPEEMQNFRTYTLGKTIVMGSKTYEWIGRALPKRRNIMMTRNPEKVQVGEMETVCENGSWRCIGKKTHIEIVTSLEELGSITRDEDEVLILGGSQIYALFLGANDTCIRVSEIHGTYEGDIYFPEFLHLYEESSRESFSEFDVVNYKLRTT